MHFIGFTRIKNEARWIERVIAAQLPLVEHLHILDDHSTDNTREICRSFDKVTVYESPFQGIDESRDKQWLMEKVYDSIPEHDQQQYTHGNIDSPYWAVCFDGDEELITADIPLLHEACDRVGVHAVALRILYLWDRPDQWRTDGVYGNFRRPSLFRLFNRGFSFQKTPFGNGANFHCSSIPQELLANANASQSRCEAKLLHWGYIDRDLRMRKHNWYNTIDPNNHAEDCYRHCVQGDVPEVPAEARLRWAGPLQVQAL